MDLVAGLPMKSKLILVILILAAYFGLDQFVVDNTTGNPEFRADRASSSTYDEWQSGQQVQGSGRVIRILPDDNDGSRHQRFIIEIGTGQTLLIAHNIDLAPRVTGINEGDTISFNGEYEWNDRGGVIHWTHKDPRGNHEAGWIEHKNSLYQ